MNFYLYLYLYFHFHFFHFDELLVLLGDTREHAAALLEPAERVLDAVVDEEHLLSLDGVELAVVVHRVLDLVLLHAVEAHEAVLERYADDAVERVVVDGRVAHRVRGGVHAVENTRGGIRNGAVISDND